MTNTQLDQLLKREERERLPFGKDVVYEKYRKILVDYLWGFELNLPQKTLHQAMALQDRIYNTYAAKSHDLLLVADTCLLIAYKSEADPSSIHQLFTLLTFPRDQILVTEKKICSRIQPLHLITSFRALEELFAAYQTTTPEKKWAEYFLKLSLQHYTFVAYAASMVAAASLFNSHKALNSKPPEELNTFFPKAELAKCADALWEQHHVQGDYLRLLIQKEKGERLPFQSDICRPNRRMLIDELWCFENKVSTEALYRAADLLDRLLQTAEMEEESLHLALCCLLLACKLEDCDENNTPIYTLLAEMGSFKVPVLKLETKILPHLDHLGAVTRFQALQELFALYRPVKYVHEWALYFLNLSAQHYTFSAYPPSVIAASSLINGCKAFSTPSKLFDLPEPLYAFFQRDQLEECAKVLWETHISEIGKLS